MNCVHLKTRRNKFVKYDEGLLTDLRFDQVTYDIYIGPYVQTYNDVKVLADCGIKAVLNLQTDTDMRKRSIHFAEVLK